MFTSFSMMVVKAVLGPKGAFPSWIMLILTSSANGCVFYGACPRYGYGSSPVAASTRKRTSLAPHRLSVASNVAR
jgi:hypothetical protein